MSTGENERLKETIARLRAASHHVYRQQKHGKHEQDRADAVEWMANFEAALEWMAEFETAGK